jgi:hypothetical protein
MRPTSTPHPLLCARWALPPLQPPGHPMPHSMGKPQRAVQRAVGRHFSHPCPGEYLSSAPAGHGTYLLQPACQHEYALHCAREVLAGLGQLDFGKGFLLEVIDVPAALQAHHQLSVHAVTARAQEASWTSPLGSVISYCYPGSTRGPSGCCAGEGHPDHGASLTLPMMEPAAAFDTNSFV